MIRRSVYFSGRVQGVGFRYTTCSLARGFQISGFVKNLSDGRVQAVIEGELPEVERFQDAVVNEMGRMITEVSHQDSPATGEYDGFKVRF